MAVSGHVLYRKDLRNRRAQAAKRLVLRVFKPGPFRSFEFYADGVIIAIGPPSVTGNSGMPGALRHIHKLRQFAIAPDVKVGGHLHPPDLRIVGMQFPIKLIGEQALDLVAPILARRQTDRMDHDQVN